MQLYWEGSTPHLPEWHCNLRHCCMHSRCLPARLVRLHLLLQHTTSSLHHLMVQVLGPQVLRLDHLPAIQFNQKVPPSVESQVTGLEGLRKTVTAGMINQCFQNWNWPNQLDRTISHPNSVSDMNWLPPSPRTQPNVKTYDKPKSYSEELQ